MIDLAQIVRGLTGRGVRVEFVAEHLDFAPTMPIRSPCSSCICSGRSPSWSGRRSVSVSAKGSSRPKRTGCIGAGVRKLTGEQVAETRRLDGAGVPKAKIARDLGCSRRVLYDALAGRGAYAPRGGEPGPHLAGWQGRGFPGATCWQPLAVWT